jgi:hypothetical protein
LKNEETQKYIPTYTTELYDATIDGTNVTYMQILSQMRDYALNFMIHLCHTIQKLEPSVRGSVEPPTAATSGAAAAAADDEDE